MKLDWEPITLELKTTFRVAHGASDQRFNVLVYLDDGVGEAAAVPYYGETQEGIIEYLKSVPDLGDDPFDMDAFLTRRPAGSRAARSAIDEALHDLWGKKLGQPLYKLFGLNPGNLPLTSFTIGMDGGINQNNVAQLKQNYIDTVGVAAAIFGQPDPVVALKNLYA